MKILFLSPLLPYPLLSGGQIRSYNLIKELAKNHEITLCSFIRKDEEKKYLPELQKYCKKIKIFKRRKTFSLFNILLSGFTIYPFLMCTYWDPKAKKEIKEELANTNYDLIHAETFYIMHLLPRTNLPVVLGEENIEYQVYQRFADQAAFFLKPILYFDIAKIKIWEEFFWQRAKKIVVTSTLDLEKIKRRFIHAPVSLVANGIDVSYFKNVQKRKKEKPIILFVGNFKWLQNRDAISFLISQVWPEIKKKMAGVDLVIVGRDAPAKIKKAILESGAKLYEDVSEIKEIYQKVDLLLAPIRIGGGTKFKILEAMAAGVPVVTTTVGIEGLKAKDGQEVLVADDVQGLAEEAHKILTDEILRNNLTKNAKELVLQNYDWQKISQNLDRVWQEASND